MEIDVASVIYQVLSRISTEINDHLCTCISMEQLCHRWSGITIMIYIVIHYAHKGLEYKMHESNLLLVFKIDNVQFFYQY